MIVNAIKIIWLIYWMNYKYG